MGYFQGGSSVRRGTPRRSSILGDLGPDAVALAAQKILAGLPAGSGVNPITQAMQNAKGSAYVSDPAYPPTPSNPDGGFRNIPYYWAFPVQDPSGLIEWTGADSAQFKNGLSEAQILAANVLLAGGDTSGFADFHPVNSLQYTAPQNTAPAAPAVYSGNNVMDNNGYKVVAVIPPPTAPTAASLAADAAAAALAASSLQAIQQAGGDPTQPTAIIDQQSGQTLSVVRYANDGSLLMNAPATSSRDIVQTVTGIIDKAAGAITGIGTQLQKVGNAVQGAEAGAQAGYSLNVNPQTLLLAGGGLLLAVLVFGGSRSRRH